MKYRDLFTDYDEEEILRFENYLTSLSSAEIENLYDYLIQLSVDENLKINDTLLDGRISVKGSNQVEFSGTGEHSSQESSAYLDIYLDNILLGELVFYLEQRFSSEGYITSLEFIEEENAMAKLSERVYGVEYPCPWENGSKPIISHEHIKQMNKPITLKQENIMNNTTTNTLREVTITLVDNNVNLEDDQRVVFQKTLLGYFL